MLGDFDPVFCEVLGSGPVAIVGKPCVVLLEAISSAMTVDMCRRPLLRSLLFSDRLGNKVKR